MSSEVFKTRLIEFLKGKAVKVALKKLLGSAALGGFKAWLIKFIVIELFEEVAQPLILLAYRKGMRVVDEANGKLKVKKIEKAKEEGSEDGYTSTIGTV